MSDYSVISAVSQTLLTLLTTNITNSTDSQIKNVPIDLQSPTEVEGAHGTPSVSVWLYRVSRMGDMLNEPPLRISATQIVNTPLPILLYYLITPVAEDPLTRHALMGKVLQVMNDHAILRGADLQGILMGTTDQLRVVLETLTLEELSLVWDALSEPYQLSVSYMIQLASIDSAMQPVKTSRVLERNSVYSQILSAN